jgi:hypothetical protein
MPQLSVLRSVDDVPVSEWDELIQEADIDFSRGFLQFREYLEPGESVLLTIRSAGQLRGALRGVVTVPDSGLTRLPSRRRRLYRVEEQRLRQAADLQSQLLGVTDGEGVFTPDQP